MASHSRMRGYVSKGTRRTACLKIGEENTGQIRRFGELLKLINTGADDDFAREIGERMDLDQFAGYLAATSILAPGKYRQLRRHAAQLLPSHGQGRWEVAPAAVGREGIVRHLYGWEARRKPWLTGISIAHGWRISNSWRGCLPPSLFPSSTKC